MSIFFMLWFYGHEIECRQAKMLRNSVNGEAIPCLHVVPGGYRVTLIVSIIVDVLYAFTRIRYINEIKS